MNRNIIVLLLAIAGIIGSLVAPQRIETPGEDSKIKIADEPSMNSPDCNLKTDMRKLWEDHVVWTRNVVFNIMDGLPGTDHALKRLLKNQDEIGDAIKPYYGVDAGKQLAGLLREHITIAAHVKAFDNTVNQILKMSDMISAEIVKQFSEKFKGNRAIGMSK